MKPINAIIILFFVAVILGASLAFLHFRGFVQLPFVADRAPLEGDSLPVPEASEESTRPDTTTADRPSSIDRPDLSSQELQEQEESIERMRQAFIEMEEQNPMPKEEVSQEESIERMRQAFLEMEAESNTNTQTTAPDDGNQDQSEPVQTEEEMEAAIERMRQAFREMEEN